MKPQLLLLPASRLLQIQSEVLIRNQPRSSLNINNFRFSFSKNSESNHTIFYQTQAFVLTHPFILIVQEKKPFRGFDDDGNDDSINDFVGFSTTDVAKSCAAAHRLAFIYQDELCKVCSNSSPFILHFENSVPGFVSILSLAGK